MSISKKPTRKDNKPVTIDDAINSVIKKGGSSPKQEHYDVLQTKRKGYPLRLYPFTINEVKGSVETMQRQHRRKPNFSMHKWIEEAIDEKLQRERGEGNEQ